MSDWKEWFSEYAKVDKYRFVTVLDGRHVEEMYQMFKQRLLEEMAEEDKQKAQREYEQRVMD